MTQILFLLFACGGAPEAAHDDHAAKDDAHAEHGEKADHAEKADAHGEHGAHGEAAGMPAQPAVPADAAVKFESPANGATVHSPVHVVMGVHGMKVQKAGEVVAGTGHHHIIIDGEPVPMGTAVPADDTHIHFGGGQTEVDLELAPGKHVLTLQFADGLHRSYGKAMSGSIEITVE